MQQQSGGICDLVTILKQVLFPQYTDTEKLRILMDDKFVKPTINFIYGALQLDRTLCLIKNTYFFFFINITIFILLIFHLLVGLFMHVSYIYIYICIVIVVINKLL